MAHFSVENLGIWEPWNVGGSEPVKRSAVPEWEISPVLEIGSAK